MFMFQPSIEAYRLYEMKSCASNLKYFIPISLWTTNGIHLAHLSRVIRTISIIDTVMLKSTTILIAHLDINTVIETHNSYFNTKKWELSEYHYH